MISKIKSILYDILTATIGELLVLLQPKKSKYLSKKGMTVVMGNNLSFTEKLMRRALLKKAEQKNDFEAIEEYHQNYWKNNGPEFFDSTISRLKNDLVTSHFIFKNLKEQLLKEKSEFDTLVEIGTGNGTVLAYLNEELPHLQQFIGIDLSEEQTIINNEKYKQNSKLSFVNSDGFDWVKENGQNNTIFLTFMGVLEYFTESRLQDFLSTIACLDKIIFIAIEPNGLKHDFTKNPNSIPYGTERSFSHNYLKLFQNSKFRIWHYSQKKIDGDHGIISYIGAIK